jgi:hypothetical protein
MRTSVARVLWVIFIDNIEDRLLKKGINPKEGGLAQQTIMLTV